MYYTTNVAASIVMFTVSFAAIFVAFRKYL